MIKGVDKPQDFSVQKNESKIEENKLNIDENQIKIDDVIGESILERETVNALMKEASETEHKTKKKKTAITSTIFLLINIVLMSFIVKNLLDSTNNTDFYSVAQLQGDRLWWLAAGFGLIILFFLADTLLFYFLIKKTTGKRKPFLAYRLSSVGKYYDFITPTQVGGQPSQILRLTRSGVGAGLATSIPIIKLIVYSLTSTVISAILYFFAVPLIPTTGGLQTFLMALIKIVGAIGLIITVIFSFLYLIIGNGKIMGRAFVQWLVKVGYKLHIVKNYRTAYDKLLTQVKEYQSSIKYLKKNKGTLFLTIFLCVVECLSFALVPFCVVMAFSQVDFLTSAEAFYCILLTMSEYYLCTLVSTCLPLPGGTGSLEVCFIFLFAIGAYSVGDQIAWALIFFRVITYYGVILHGFIHIIVETIIKFIRNKRNNESLMQSNVETLEN